MKFITPLILAFALMPFANASEWCPEFVQVTEINAGYADGLILFRAGTTHNPAECNGNALYAAHPDSADTKDILSMLLYAKATQTPIKIAVNKTQCGGWGYPQVLRMKLQ